MTEIVLRQPSFSPLSVTSSSSSMTRRQIKMQVSFNIKVNCSFIVLYNKRFIIMMNSLEAYL